MFSDPHPPSPGSPQREPQHPGCPQALHKQGWWWWSFREPSWVDILKEHLLAHGSPVHAGAARSRCAEKGHGRPTLAKASGPQVTTSSGAHVGGGLPRCQASSSSLHCPLSPLTRPRRLQARPGHALVGQEPTLPFPWQKVRDGNTALLF